MTLTLSNSNLPASVPTPFNLSVPMSKLDIGESPVPLLIVDTFYKYSGITAQSTNITTPDAIYDFYALNLPFDVVLEASIEFFVPVTEINRLTGQRFYLEDTRLYFVSSVLPANCRITAEIFAPIPRTECELITSIPTGMSVTQILSRGIPLSFGQVGQLLTIDCSDSCCKIRGGETLEIKGDYWITIEPSNKFYVFNVGQDVGLIDYVDWWGLRFVAQQGEVASGQFLWDSAIKSLKLII